MNVIDIKAIIGLKNDKHDAYITSVIPLFIEQAKDYCNNSFLVNGVEELPAGVKLFVAKAIEFNMGASNLKGRTMGDVSYSYETDLPRSITKFLAPHRKVRF